VGAKGAIRSGIGNTEKHKSLFDLLLIEEVLLGLIHFTLDEFSDTTGTGTAPTGRG
jgi:hypothetical protein